MNLPNTKLEPGDIGAVKGRGLLHWLLFHVTKPKTDRFHYFIIWGEIGHDYLILESIASKGLSVGKLSWYDNQDVIFYRANCDQDLRQMAPCELIDYGRSKYDFPLVFKVVSWAIWAWTRMMFRCEFGKLKAEDFPYRDDSALICTEAVVNAYLSVGVQVIDAGVLPIPSAFKEAELERRIVRLP